MQTLLPTAETSLSTTWPSSSWTGAGIRLGKPLGAQVELAPLLEDQEDLFLEGTDDPETAETEKSGRLLLR